MDKESKSSSTSGDWVFLVIVAEKLFATRLGVLSKDRGQTYAQQIHRRFSKKVGPTNVLSLVEANEKRLRKRLYPAPKVLSPLLMYSLALPRRFHVIFYFVERRNLSIVVTLWIHSV